MQKSKESLIKLPNQRYHPTDKTIKNLKKASIKNCPTIYYLLAKAYRKKNDLTSLKKALFYIEKAKNLQKKDLSFLYEESGNIYKNIYILSQEPLDLKKAISEYEKCKNISFNLFKSKGFLYFKLGFLINDEKAYQKASKSYKKAYSIKKNKNILYKIANCFLKKYLITFSQDDFKKASYYFEKCLSNKNISLKYAKFLSFAGKNSKNIKLLQKALDILKKGNSTYFKAQFSETLAILGAIKENFLFLKKSKKIISTEIKKHPKISKLWYSYGIILQSFRNYFDDALFDLEAISKLKKALFYNKKNPKIKNALANSYANLSLEYEDNKYIDLANKYYKKAIFHEKSPQIIYDYSYFLFKTENIDNLKIENLKIAIKHMQTIFSFKNSIIENPKWLFLYGMILKEMGEILENKKYFYLAIEIFKKLLIIDPEYKDANFNIATCYSNLGYLDHLKKALHYFKKEKNITEETYLEYATTLMMLADIEEKPILYKKAKKKLIKAALLGCERAYYYLGCLFSITKSFDLSFYFLEKAKQKDILPPIEELKEDIWLENIRIKKEYKKFISDIHH